MSETESARPIHGRSNVEIIEPRIGAPRNYTFLWSEGEIWGAHDIDGKIDWFDTPIMLISEVKDYLIRKGIINTPLAPLLTPC